MNLAPLGSVARFVNGFAFEPSDWGETGLPIIRIQNLTGTADKLNYTERQVKPDLVVESGDLLVSWSATLDVYRWQGPRALLNQHIFRVFPADTVTRDYLFFALKHVLADIVSRTHGSTMKHVKRKDFESTQIPLPLLPEQRRIADILCRAESIVRLQKQAAEKAREIIPALFIDMFGDPATNSKGWEVVPLGELLRENPTLGSMLKPTGMNDSWLDLRVANIQVGELVLEDKKWVDLPVQDVTRHSLRNGDLILARAIGSLEHLGKAVVVYPNERKWAYDSHLMRVRTDPSRLLPEYLKHFLESEGGRTEFMRHTRRSAVQFNINGKELRRISLPVPPIEMQREFSKRIQQAQSLARLRTSSIVAATSAFQSLLHRAFTGQL